jgi:hypothetical protein
MIAPERRNCGEIKLSETTITASSVTPCLKMLSRSGFGCGCLIRWSQFRILFLHDGHELVEVLEHQCDVSHIRQLSMKVLLQRTAGQYIRLDYDPVALVVLVVGMSGVALLALSI